MTRRQAPLRRTRRAGYVLVEALATLAISAFLIAGLASLVSLVLGSADRTALAVQSFETTDRAIAAVARDFAQAVRARLLAGGERAFAFDGKADTLLFAIDRPDETGLLETVVVRWTSAVSAAGRGALTRTEAPLRPDTAALDALAFGAGRTIDTGPVVITFGYFGPNPEGPGEILADLWLDPAQLPLAVRLGRTNPADGSLAGSVRVLFPVDGEPGCALPGKSYCSLVRRSGGDMTLAPGQPTGDTGGPPESER